MSALKIISIIAKGSRNLDDRRKTVKLNYTETYKWKWVCIQHPMILISRDMSEPRALETVPPWGAGSILGYCIKMRDVLKKIIETPELKIDFDLSAKELLLFFENIPEGKDLLRTLLAQKRIGFTGCDYSQAHYGTARSESALRQIRMGAEVYKKELEYVTDTFQHQETGVFENLPQLLKVFGIKKGAIHSFQAVIRFIESPSLEICSNFGRLEFIHNETFGLWCGLDGSCVPLYLPVVVTDVHDRDEVSLAVEPYIRPEFKGESKLPASCNIYPMDYEESRGLYRNGSIVIQVPDLVSINDEYITNRKRVGDFWNISEALDEEMKTETVMPKIRYYTYWSYAEGEFGEMMFKEYRIGEEKILAAETIQCIASASGIDIRKFDAVSAWDKLLTAQHHDVNWLDAKEMKEWALGGIKDAEKKADLYILEAARALCSPPASRTNVVVFNTLPEPRKDLASFKSDSNYRVFDKSDRELVSQYDNGTLLFEASLDGLGYKSYTLKESSNQESAEENIRRSPYVFENDLIKTTVLPDGRISSIYSKISGERLRGYGNLIRGKLVNEDRTEKWISNEGAASCMTVTEGRIVNKIVTAGIMENIPYRMIIKLYHGACARIDIDLELDFKKHEIGDHWHDETKLNVYWELNQNKSEIYYDEPFGWIRGKHERPLLSANFVLISENQKGLLFQHRGTPKSWLSNNTYACLLAWGAKNFTNRFHKTWASFDAFDMRLDRNCGYSYSIYVAENDNIGVIAKNISGNITPLVAVQCGGSAGEKTFLTVKNENLITTAVEQMGEDIAVRMYDASGRASILEFETFMRFISKTDAAGKIADSLDIRPFEIFELHFGLV
jgi:hypothetical protein